MRGVSASSSWDQAVCVPTCTPAEASTNTIAASATRSAACLSPAKSAQPGVSTRLIFVPSWVNEARAMLMVKWRFCSSGSVSRMLVPSSTLPRRVVAPTAWRMDSTRLVLPDPPWPTTATFLIFVGSGDGIELSPALGALIVFRAMSGHSKWSQIKRQKGAADVKRGVIFTKMTKEIMIAAKEGGGDPDGNFRLRLAMDRARDVNMPRENIQRAIDRAIGSGDAAALESVVYEGYAPGGVSVMIEAATDNRNRTVSEIRAAFTRGGGKLGESGSVQWLFEQKGVIEIDAKGKDADVIELAAIDAGAEDVEAEPGLITVYTTPAAFERVKKALETAGIKVASAELSMRPTTTVRVEGDQAKKLLGLVKALEDLDDVIKVHANFDVPEEVLQHA